MHCERPVRQQPVDLGGYAQVMLRECSTRDQMPRPTPLFSEEQRLDDGACCPTNAELNARKIAAHATYVCSRVSAWRPGSRCPPRAIPEDVRLAKDAGIDCDLPMPPFRSRYDFSAAAPLKCARGISERRRLRNCGRVSRRL